MRRTEEGKAKGKAKGKGKGKIGDTLRRAEAALDTKGARHTKADRAKGAGASGEDSPESFRAYLKASGRRPLTIKAIAPHKDKRIAKEIRATMKMPAPPKNPYAALMEPMVIVPDNPEHKVVIADAGSIIKLADQRVMFRDRVSPITRLADEILVYYGKANRPSLGWLTNRQPSKIMKPSTGPTFLVTTKAEDSLVAWEQFRLKTARLRHRDPSMWIARWLATHGAKHSKQLKEVTRYFGGKTKKNEGFDARCTRLFSLILNTELDMASAKKGSKTKTKKSSKKTQDESASKKSKSGKKSSKKSGKKSGSKLSASGRITSKHDEHVIVRLVKENPRRAGSKWAKVWDKLKKGMTVGEFVQKGGSRGSVGKYLRNGWIKLKKTDAE